MRLFLSLSKGTVSRDFRFPFLRLAETHACVKTPLCHWHRGVKLCSVTDTGDSKMLSRGTLLYSKLKIKFLKVDYLTKDAIDSNSQYKYLREIKALFKIALMLKKEWKNLILTQRRNISAMQHAVLNWQLRGRFFATFTFKTKLKFVASSPWACILEMEFAGKLPWKLQVCVFNKTAGL